MNYPPQCTVKLRTTVIAHRVRRRPRPRVHVHPFSRCWCWH